MIEMNLLQMSFSGACFILAVVVIRALAINHLPKKTFLVLWNLVLLRLLVPFSIPSMFSIYTWIAQCVPVSDLTQMDRNHLTAAMPLEEPNMMQEIPKQTAGSLSVSVWTIVWCAGALLLMVFFMASYFHCRREFQNSVPVSNDFFIEKWLKKRPIKRMISIRQSDRILTPLTYGIIHPVILLPHKTDWNNTEHLQYVLMHEYIHICRYDALTKLVITMALCIHWFNPMAWVMYILFNRDIELSCDESVVQSFGEKSKSAYSLMLIGMEEQKSRLQTFYSNFSKNAAEERITSIMKMKKTTVFSTILACMVVIGTAAAFTTSIQTKNKNQIFMPQWMQPYSIIVYDENLNCTIIQGGELESEEINEREDIAEIGFYDYSPENLAQPNTKVEYDLHGFIQNVYYLVPGTTDSYALDPNTRYELE